MKIKCTQTRHKSLFVLHLSHAVAQNNFRDSVDVLCGICNNMLLFQLWSYDRYQVRGLPAKHMCIMFMPRSSSEDSQLRHTLFNDEILSIFGTVWMCCAVFLIYVLLLFQLWSYDRYQVWGLPAQIISRD